MKLLNTAPDMNGFSVIVITIGLSCYHKDLYIYGHQDVEETDGGNVHLENLHFVGRFSKFELVEAEMIDSFNRCVFKSVVDGFSPYMFVRVKRIPDIGTWRICEIDFV